MSATEAAPQEAPTLRCDLCEFEAKGRQGLASHKFHSHGMTMSGQTAKARPEPDLDAEMLREVDDAVNAATRAIAQRLEGIDREISDGERRVKQLKSTRRYLASRLRSINPEAMPEGKPGPRRTTQGEARGLTKDPEKLAAVEAAVRTTEGEFLSTDIYKRLKDERVSGGPTLSTDVVRKIVRDMHARGEIRAVRIVRGGAQTYAMIGSNNGAA